MRQDFAAAVGLDFVEDEISTFEAALVGLVVIHVVCSFHVVS